MKLKTGVKTLMGISIIAIAAAIYDIVTCPLSALLSFMIAQRLSTSEYETLREQGAAVSTLRGFPVRKTEIFAVEASLLAVAVFLAVIVLCYLILRQRGFHLLGVPITTQFMGLAVFLIGVWNLFFSGVLAVERTYLGMAF